MIRSRYGNDEHYGLIPSYHQVESFIYREKKQMIPSLPHSRRDTKLTGDFRKTIKGHDFLLNEQEGEEKIILQSSFVCLASVYPYQPIHYPGEAKPALEDSTFARQEFVFPRVLSKES